VDSGYKILLDIDISSQFADNHRRGDRAAKAKPPNVLASRPFINGDPEACKPVALCASRVQIPSPALFLRHFRGSF